MATNAFDETIHDFCKSKHETLFQFTDQATIQKHVTDLRERLRKEAISKFSAPLAGRITDFVPFLTFSATEQAAIVHKCLTELRKDLAKPVVISEDETRQRSVGNIDLQVPKDYSICRIIAEKEYLESLGARSLINGVNRMIESVIIDHYLEIHDEIKEDQDITTYRLEVNVDGGIEVCYIPPSTTMNDGTGQKQEKEILEESRADSGSEF